MPLHIHVKFSNQLITYYLEDDVKKVDWNLTKQLYPCFILKSFCRGRRETKLKDNCQNADYLN